MNSDNHPFRRRANGEERSKAKEGQGMAQCEHAKWEWSPDLLLLAKSG